MTLENKEIMANNIKRLLEQRGSNGRQLALTLGFKYTTVNDWLNAKSYPRIDKIEKMANFFNVEKSDLVEKPEKLEDYAERYFDKQITKLKKEKAFIFSNNNGQIEAYKRHIKLIAKEGTGTLRNGQFKKIDKTIIEKDIDDYVEALKNNPEDDFSMLLLLSNDISGVLNWFDLLYGHNPIEGIGSNTTFENPNLSPEYYDLIHNDLLNLSVKINNLIEELKP